MYKIHYNLHIEFEYLFIKLICFLYIFKFSKTLKLIIIDQEKINKMQKK